MIAFVASLSALFVSKLSVTANIMVPTVMAAATEENNDKVTQEVSQTTCCSMPFLSFISDPL